MKAFEIIWKVLLAIAALAGLIFIAIKYGDEIMAWCKNMCQRARKVVDGEVVAENVPAEETPAEEVPADPLEQIGEEDFENC